MDEKNRTSTDTAAASGSERPRRPLRRRILLTLFWMAAILLIVSGVTLWVITRSWFIIAQVQPELERRVGGPVHIAEATYKGNGRFVFRGVVIRAPGHRGAAGRVGQIDRAELTLDPSRLLVGRKEVEALRLDGVHLRLSEDAQHPGQFSFMALRPDWSSDPDDDAETVLPPRIELRDLHVELGRHDGRAYERIGVRRLAGEMHPSSDARTWYVFELGEVNERGVSLGDKGLRIKGGWDVMTNEHNSRMDGLFLDERTYAMCPQIVRDWWDRMELEGRVSGVEVSWQRNAPVTVEFDVADVALTIPVETENIWARYRNGRVEATPSRPRMRVYTGAIRLEGDHLTLENLSGELGAADADENVVGVPYTVRLEIPALPDLEWQNRATWLDDALRHAAFEMEFGMDGFSLSADDARMLPAVDLPLVVAQALERFEMKDWVLDTKVTISRARPIKGPDGTLIAQDEVWNGQAFIKDASCRYENFPYPLDDVDAYLEFDREAVQLHYLYGYGSDHTRIRLSGEISPPSNEAAVHLKLAAEGVPIDDQLREALDHNQRDVFDALLHEPSYRGLDHAGLIADKAAIDQMRQRREAIVHELSALLAANATGDASFADAPPSDRVARLRRELARVDRIIQAGPFQLGGYVDLDLRIDREQGRGQSSYVTGTMTIRRGGLVYEQFPYPLNITGGTIEWHTDRIQLREDDEHHGLEFVTPGGGIGSVTGAVLFPSGTSRVEPQLVIEVADDRINDIIIAAIPPTEQPRKRWQATSPTPPGSSGTFETVPEFDWPGARRSRVGDMLAGLGLQGTLNYRGRIEAEDSGRINYDFAVAVSDASARPQEQASAIVSESGLFWPEGFDVHDISALLRVSRDSLQMLELNGTHSEGGLVTGNGYMNLAARPVRTEFIVSLLDLQIGRYLLDLAPREGLARARELWDRYMPVGLFDATMVYRTQSDQPTEPELRLRPKHVQATVDDKPVTFERAEGELWLRDNQVHFEDLLLRLSSDDQPQGELMLNGTYGVLVADQNLELVGRWSNGRMECPIIIEAMRLIGAETEADEFSALKPAGDFDATFRYRSPRENAPSDFELALEPRTFSIIINDTIVNATVHDGGVIHVAPGRIATDNLTGMIGEGEFRVTSSVRDADDQTRVRMEIQYDGRLSSPEVLALMPTTAREALEAIEFRDAAGSSIREGLLELHQPKSSAGQPNGKRPWSSSFRALVTTDDASFSGGLDFEQIDGTFDISLSGDVDQQTQMTIIADAQSIRTLGNTMHNVTANVTLLPDDRIAVRHYHAELHGGVVTADAVIGVGERRDYESTVSVAGVAIERLLSKDDDASNGTTRSSLPRGGDVYGQLSIRGERGVADLQTGRGSVRIAQGPIARMPFLLAVLHVLELMPPLSDSLDFGDIAFYIEGDQAVFEQMLFECPTLRLRGEGSMNLSTLDLDVLFRSRSTMAVVGDVVGGVSDQLFGIRVSGPLTDPNASLVPLPGLSADRHESEPMPPAARSRAAATID